MTYRVSLLRWATKPYRRAWEDQERLAVAARECGSESLILVEHPPVYTFGRRIRPEHLLIAAQDLKDRGADVVESDRGGDITFHGPGQIVGYPILDLRKRGLGPSDYVRSLEETLIRALGRFGIAASRSPGRPGVWVGNSKIAAIGVRVRGGVTTHGFALNVSTDLRWFDAIVPCGLAGAGVTSMLHEVGGGRFTRTDVEDALVAEFESVFDTETFVNGFTTSVPRKPEISLTAATAAREAVLAHGH